MVPYLIGGVGVIHHKGIVINDTNFFTGAPVTFDTSYTTWSASAGAGLKVFVSKRLFIAPEARLRVPANRESYCQHWLRISGAGLKLLTTDNLRCIVALLPTNTSGPAYQQCSCRLFER